MGGGERMIRGLCSDGVERRDKHGKRARRGKRTLLKSSCAFNLCDGYLLTLGNRRAGEPEVRRFCDRWKS